MLWCTGVLSKTVRFWSETATGTLYVALEFVPHGNLRILLRKFREGDEKIIPEGLPSSLPPEQLLQFGLDVAKGMKHLAAAGVIHRDLAARNILVGDGLVAKVSDFGLSRGEEVYVQRSTQRVPTRWLAIESLISKTYSTKTDVWSFGILLWEIVTLGGTPYTAIETRDVTYRLRAGYRMPKPEHCEDDMYMIMLECWKENPEDRPTFDELVGRLATMIGEKKIYVNTSVIRQHAPIRLDRDDN